MSANNNMKGEQFVTQANMELVAARNNYRRARLEFDRLLGAVKDLPTGHPDSTAVVHTANQLLHEAGKRFSRALVRYQEVFTR